MKSVAICWTIVGAAMIVSGNVAGYMFFLIGVGMFLMK